MTAAKERLLAERTDRSGEWPHVQTAGGRVNSLGMLQHREGASQLKRREVQGPTWDVPEERF